MKTSLPALALAPLMAACVPENQPAPSIGLANPASVYCLKQGGTLEIREEAGGTVGYCKLADGTVVDEWEYFRANNP